MFGRKEATATTEDATKALYVHIAFDGGIFVVRGDGRQAWMTQARLDDELVELRASCGRLIYSRDDPEHEPPEHVNDIFKRIVDSRPAGIQLLEEAHPVAAAHGKQDVTIADRSARGDHRRTAADLARQDGHQATVSLLDQFHPA